MPDKFSSEPDREKLVFRTELGVERARRWQKLNISGATIWFTGLSGSGKSTLAAKVEQMLIDSGQPAYMLDGDNLRHGLNSDLGFSPEDRDENVRRTGEVALLFSEAGVVSLVPLISPYRKARERVRQTHKEKEIPFWEVFMDTPLELCEERDPKGLYKQARKGEITGFTGLDDPYEAPVSPDLCLKPDAGDLAQQAQRVLQLLRG